ncbi:MAG: sulfatase-like hydrolase/transferase, partial [Deltaproteobacteria bacterium]|nr:sulfatase-like hydrolase/transferase [Deltaproteobacteria bacterium]
TRSITLRRSFTPAGIGPIRYPQLWDKSLFLYVATTAPHGPWVYARRDRKRFKGFEAPRPPSFREADMSDKPAAMQRLKEFPDDRLEMVDTWYRGYLRCLAGVDHAVDRILDALDRFDETRDTYVIFTSDNGFLFGEHWDIGKLSPYEPSIRVPLIVRGPDVRVGTVAGELALNLDLAPTLLEIAGAPTQEDLDGRSLVPLLRERAGTGWRDDFLMEQLDFEEKPDAEGDPQLPPYVGVRTERYVYVEYLGSAEGERELYDLEIDPDQMENLAGKAEVAEIEGRLAARLAELRGCKGAGCR